MIQNGTIIFRNGIITAEGADIDSPAGTRVVDATGQHIYSGLIDAYSAVGISEVGAVDMSNDGNEVGDFNPNIRADVGVNVESQHIGTSRSHGVLATLANVRRARSAVEVTTSPRRVPTATRWPQVSRSGPTRASWP